MIYLEVIWEAIKANVIGACIGLLAFLATMTIFIPKDSKIYKILTFLTKKK
jgi:hypothetical protein